MAIQFFDCELAGAIGVNAAIIFRILAGKIACRDISKGRIIDGLQLTYRDINESCQYFSHWTVKRKVPLLIQLGLITAKKCADNCMAYGITEKGKKIFYRTLRSDTKGDLSAVWGEQIAESDPSAEMLGGSAEMLGGSAEMLGGSAEMLDPRAEMLGGGAKATSPSSIQVFTNIKNKIEETANLDAAFAEKTANDPANDDPTLPIQIDESWRPSNAFYAMATRSGVPINKLPPNLFENVLSEFIFSNTGANPRRRREWELSLIRWIQNHKNKHTAQHNAPRKKASKAELSRQAIEGFLNGQQ